MEDTNKKLQDFPKIHKQIFFMLFRLFYSLLFLHIYLIEEVMRETFVDNQAVQLIGEYHDATKKLQFP